MANWRLSCAVMTAADLQPALAHFSWIDVAIFEFRRSLGLEGPQVAELAAALRPWRDRISGVHSEIDYLQRDEDGLPILQRDLALMDSLDVRLGVCHLLHPLDAADVRRQLDFLDRALAAQGVTFALENLADRKDLCRGYDWVRHPEKMAETLEAFASPHLALCLDTSHTACRRIRRLDHPAVRRQALVIHLSGGRPDEDAHAPIGPDSDPDVLDQIAAIVAASPRDGVLVFENHTAADAIRGLEYLRAARPDWLRHFAL